MATMTLDRPRAAKMQSRLPRLTKADILDQGGLRSGYYEITPELARWVLEHHNPYNRRLKPQRVEALVDDMVHGRFVTNGESIIFDWNGNAIDAQHRLTGCAVSGVSIVSLVAFGVDPEARKTVDQAAVRTTGDVLTIEGVPYGNLVSSIAKMIISYQRGDGTTLTRMGNISRGAIDEYVKEHSDIVDIAKFGDRHQSRKVLRATIAGFCYWLLASRYGVDVATEYLGKIASGEDLKLGDGALAARNRLIAETNNQQATRIEIILRGFVYHYTGKHCGRIHTTGSFPKLPAILRAAA